ncbi:hypothetical protein [Neisseria sp. KEM232]|nr:hypothetical protein [Neisseria sp. KEM232]
MIDYRHQHRLAASDFGCGGGIGFADLLKGLFHAFPFFKCDDVVAFA